MSQDIGDKANLQGFVLLWFWGWYLWVGSRVSWRTALTTYGGPIELEDRDREYISVGVTLLDFED